MAHSQTDSPAKAPALEKVPHAAQRMGTSTSNFYRIAKRDGLKIIKIGARASAVSAESVDNWIASRIAEAMGVRHG